MSAICARLSKGKVGVQRGRKTAGCPSFLPPPRGAARSRRPQTANPPLRFSEKLPARQGRTRLRQFVCPGQPVEHKEPPVRSEPACGSSRAPLSRCRKELPVRGEPACGSSCAPVSRCSERSRPSGSNPPAAVRVPRSAGAEKEPPVRGEPACGSSRAPLSRCRKGAARQGRTRLRQFEHPAHLVPRKEKHRRIASTVLKVCTFTQIAAAYRHPYAPAPAGPVPDDRAR